MWQHHYVIHAMRMEALRNEAELERRWRLADRENGRPGHASGPGPVRGAVARLAAAVARFADLLARQLDEGSAIDLGPERAVRDA